MILVLIVILMFGYKNSDEPNVPSTSSEAKIQGIAKYYVYTLVYAGSGSEQNGCIVDSFTWISGQPTYTHTRVYFQFANSQTFLGKRVQVDGRVDTLWGTYFYAPKKPFPIVIGSHITILQ